MSGLSASLTICDINFKDLLDTTHLQVVGGDLLMSNPKRLEKARQDSVCNALLLKVSDLSGDFFPFFMINENKWNATSKVLPRITCFSSCFVMLDLPY